MSASRRIDKGPTDGGRSLAASTDWSTERNGSASSFVTVEHVPSRLHVRRPPQLTGVFHSTLLDA